jgi:heme/copper-type cytochrome/quinol oxidase subunit 3
VSPGRQQVEAWRFCVITVAVWRHLLSTVFCFSVFIISAFYLRGHRYDSSPENGVPLHKFNLIPLSTYCYSFNMSITGTACTWYLFLLLGSS